MDIKQKKLASNGIPEIYTIGSDPIKQRLPSFDASNRVTLSWHNLNVFVKPKKKAFWNIRNQYDINETKQLLNGVSGQVRPSQLLAIMGASGAGKTTLLNVLTNRNVRKLLVEGEVLINGQNIGAAMTRVSAFVQQDDLFIGNLTVREHLIFQAMLRMDKHLNYQERMKKVDEVTLELGLLKCQHTMIGTPGHTKGISGGERKRLAFAAEVLTNPALMFCDEPTSGLDSFMSQNIVTVLKQLSAGGRTIVCTIHQPSSETYEMFDNLLLLAEGKVAYMGPAVDALNFFQRAGLTCPVNYNPADFFIHNLAIIPGKEVECKERVKKICDQFARETLTERTLSSGCSVTGNQIEGNRYKASWCAQLKMVMWRSWISVIRDPMFTKVRFMQTLVIGLVFGLIYLNQKLDDKGIMNINGVLFLVLMNLTFQNMMSVINVFTLEQPIFLREHWNGMYRTDVYFLSRTLTELPLLFAMTTIFSTIVYWMVGLNSDYKAFLIALAIFNLVALAAAGFGYMVSCLSGSLNIALSIGTPLLMPLVLFGGFYLNDASIPVYFVWIKYISWIYYGNEALIVNQWSSVGNITLPYDAVTDGKAVIGKLNFFEEHFVRDISLIAALVVFYNVLAFVALLIRSSKKT